VSPMIAAKLYSLKGKDLNVKNKNEDSLTREEQTTRVTRRRAANLSSRSTLYSSETLTGGVFFSGPFDPNSGLMPEISLEEWYAKRLNVTVGDTMGFDIMGVPIQGKITSLRKVKWNSFQPNFFVLFQPKSLEDAPATYLGTIADIPEDKKTDLQNALRSNFSNIAMINVARMVNRILKLTAQVSLAISAMAVLAMFAGLVVVYSIARFNAQTRLKEVNLLKVIGAKHRDLKLISLIEFGLLGLLASVTGSILSLGMAKVIAEIMFDRSFEPYWGPTLLTILLVTLFSAILGFLGVKSTLAKKPQFLLQAV
ncbi:MAG: FtsX-like permease family protein, partial [SAR324 cluster bacterium]|nr:FtsX-like permease family protein [SAR324 cluster bacterium]